MNRSVLNKTHHYIFP